MTFFKLRVGPKMDNKDSDNDEPKNGWIAFWQSLVGIIFILACFAYCCRQEIVEIMK